MTGRVGWYLLRGITPYHGPIPDGVEEIAPPIVSPADAPAPLERPADTAKKPEWVDYAEALGVDTSGTKAVLVARCDEHVEALYGGDQVGAPSLVDEGDTDPVELRNGESLVDPSDEDAGAFGHGD